MVIDDGEICFSVGIVIGGDRPVVFEENLTVDDVASKVGIDDVCGFGEEDGAECKQDYYKYGFGNFFCHFGHIEGANAQRPFVAHYGHASKL